MDFIFIAMLSAAGIGIHTVAKNSNLNRKNSEVFPNSFVIKYQSTYDNVLFKSPALFIA